MERSCLINIWLYGSPACTERGMPSPGSHGHPLTTFRKNCALGRKSHLQQTVKSSGLHCFGNSIHFTLPLTQAQQRGTGQAEAITSPLPTEAGAQLHQPVKLPRAGVTPQTGIVTPWASPLNANKSLNFIPLTSLTLLNFYSRGSCAQPSSIGTETSTLPCFN